MAFATLAASFAYGGDLNRDPFRPPAEFATADNGRARPDALAISANPEIRGILYAGNNSLVNLSGKIIALGEEVDGYELLEVSENQAVFLRNGETLTLSLYADETDE
jgi:hypothetical protein